MVRKLCIRSLRRGVGSMDFIQRLLIMEDDLDEGHKEDESDVTPTPTTSTDLACSSNAGTPDPAPSPSNNAIPWCKCGVCQIMPQEIENKCCGLRRSVTTHTRFSKLCLDPDVVQLAIRNRGDIRNDRDDNSTRAFRKTGYRKYILDRYGYLGKGNRKVCPSCVVTVIRSHYPSQTGVYMGYICWCRWSLHRSGRQHRPFIKEANVSIINSVDSGNKDDYNKYFSIWSYGTVRVMQKHSISNHVSPSIWRRL